MNEINIYARYNYHKILKNANLIFGKKYVWYSPKSVFAPYNETYAISIYKNNIHVSYWDEYTKKGKKNQDRIKKFLEQNIRHKNIIIDFNNETDIISTLKANNTILKEEQHEYIKRH